MIMLILLILDYFHSRSKALSVRKSLVMKERLGSCSKSADQEQRRNGSPKGTAKSKKTWIEVIKIDKKNCN